ncbi:hypothetical protein [Vibrio parahaemolyticus]|uniref:hypothetical protein n=1 Tax=Vibrio parahaemolyticus TaxID=670 RepID=UPI0004E61791|nr:hypothetical protein [Vibrio parahaemolyticus]KFE93199.1 hypothetical protein HB39_23460 [Vibrio parahaemolyticus]MBE4096212.1 hypothetical protein [Vibrio parahaemolyticus]MBE4131237.1 hypothetical protein [Vibrio parahaemolyticus]MBX5336698.1 hypothetical protein [Vibrio parahaemolyticus]MDF5329989.1 hypothetical protein [Vibrio parahaemolyticus]
MTKLFFNIVLAFQFFPWLSFRMFEGDTQPWPLLLSLIASLFFIKNKVDKAAVMVLCAFIFSFCLAIVYCRFDVLTIRAIFGYLTLFSVYYFYLEYKKRYDAKAIIIATNIIWIVAGLIQVLVDPYVFDFLVHTRTSEARGVTGLAPEPTFYGIFLYFMCWLIYVETNFYSKDKLCRMYTLLTILNVAFIVFVAKSSMVVVFLFLTFVFLLIRNLSARLVACSVLFCLLTIPMLNVVWSSLGLEDARMFKLASRVFDGGLFLLIRDASINSRISHVYLSFYEFVTSGMLPHGYHSFGGKLEELLANSDVFYWGKHTDKIMSWLGGVLFELGFWGLIIVAWISYSMMGTAISYRKILDVSLFLLVLTSAIPLAFPLVPLILASARYQYIYKV